MNSLKTEGIILQAITFKEADQILTIWTPEGLLKLIYKGALSKKRGGGALTAPLQLAEFVYVHTRGDLGACREISIINPYAGLRLRLELLESAGEMASAILASQHVDAPAPLLYRLFVLYLENLAAAKNPFLLSASTKLKILRHEGMLSIDGKCSACQESLAELFVANGESFCGLHAPAEATAFNHEESLLLLECAYGRAMGHLLTLEPTPLFLEKVGRLFQRTQNY